MENRTGQFISERRRAIGLTQKELAERLGVTNKAVSKWETGGGMPDVSMLKKLSEILEVSVDELLAGEYAEERKGISLHKPEPEMRAPGMMSGNMEHCESPCPGKHPGQKLVRRILAGLLFLPLVLTVCMHAAYLYVSRQSTFEYIIDWLPYLFFGISILMAACGLCLLLRNKKLRTRLYCGRHARRYGKGLTAKYAGWSVPSGVFLHIAYSNTYCANLSFCAAISS